MLILPATPDDLPILLRLRDEAAAWLADKNTDQWSSAWPTKDLMAKSILRSVRADEVFIVWDDDTPAATITVDRWANPDLWTEHEAAEAAFYIHRLIVDRAYSGHGLGAELVDWAGTHAARAGATWLRLDAWTTNDALQKYYREQGFTQLRTVALSHNPSGALFQRSALERPTPSLNTPSDDALAL